MDCFASPDGVKHTLINILMCTSLLLYSSDGTEEDSDIETHKPKQAKVNELNSSAIISVSKISSK